MDVVKKQEKCKEYKYFVCPICGVPLIEGERCDDGVLIESVPLQELPEFFHNFKWEMFELYLLEVAPEWGDIEEQYAYFMIVPHVEKQKMDIKLGLLAPPGVDAERMRWAVEILIAEYKYRKDCGLVEELKEKYKEKIKEWKQNAVRITPNQRRYVYLAAQEWGTDMKTLVSLFLAYLLYDERLKNQECLNCKN